MAIKSFLRNFKARWFGLVIPLDYPWSAFPRYNQTVPISEILHARCKRHLEQFEQIMVEIPQYLEAFKTFNTSEYKDDGQIYWNNNFLPALDIVALYTILRTLNPGKVIEIGSGNSTLVMRRAIEDGHLQTQLTCVDPSPRRNITGVADQYISLRLEALQNYDRFESLSPGDIVFFDGSHLALANTDVTVFFMEILPRIPVGVYVHVHDIYLPFDYPEDMVLRGYNEQYVLAQALLYNEQKFEIVFPAFWLSRQEQVAKMLNATVWGPLAVPNLETHGGSFWFKVLS